MKRTEIVHTTLGDLIVSLTDETLRIVPQRRRAYRIVASILAGFSVDTGDSSTGGAALRRRSADRRGMLILSKPRLMRRAHLNGVSKGGEHPLWSRAGFKPRSRIQLIANAVARCACLIAALTMSACTSTFEPRISPGALEQPRLPTARAIQAGVEVSIEEYFSSQKSRRAFDADVGSSGVLPILVHVENKSGQDYRLERSAIRALVDGQPLANIHGLEAAEIGALRNPAWNALVNTAAMGPLAMFFGVGVIAGSASQTQKINRQIEHHFERMELVNRIVKPNETATGFVYFRTPGNRGKIDGLTLNITLEPELLGDHTGKSLVYRFPVPALGAQP